MYIYFKKGFLKELSSWIFCDNEILIIKKYPDI